MQEHMPEFVPFCPRLFTFWPIWETNASATTCLRARNAALRQVVASENDVNISIKCRIKK